MPETALISADAIRILVVDDEPVIRRTLGLCLEGEGYGVKTVGSIREALDQAALQYHDVAFVDLRLGLESGLDLVPALLRINPGMRIIMITAHASIENAVEAMRQGAFDYLPKPFGPVEAVLMAKKAVQARYAEAPPKPNSEPDLTLDSASPALQRVFEQARIAAASDATLLIRGETGTGKGVLARAIHAWSPRKDGPFAVVSCPAIPLELLESELFGHVQGAFTGAHREQIGRVAQARGGTLFLDEVGDLPLALQTKMLRFIQDHEYERVGDPVTRKADVRVLTATHVDLKQAVAEGRFREDLYYRLNVIEVVLPPLRERREDVPSLAQRILEKFSQEYQRPVGGFSAEAKVFLEGYPWPGNLRELSNAIERAVILSTGKEVGWESLPADLRPHQDGLWIGAPISLKTLEETHIRRIVATGKSMEECARILGIDVVTLWRKRKKYGLLFD
jgi:NtrC-family two-component system response regulator AlgB